MNTKNTIPYVIILLRKSATKKLQRFPPHPFMEHGALLTPSHPSQPTKPQLSKPRFLPSGPSLPLTAATRVKPGRKTESSQAWISRNAPQFSCRCKGSCGTSEHSSRGKKPHQVCCRLPGVIQRLWVTQASGEISSNKLTGASETSILNTHMQINRIFLKKTLKEIECFLITALGPHQLQEIG